MATVLQFGGGVFLRGFVEVFVDEANEHLPIDQHHKVCIVERTRSDTAQAIIAQNNRYTVLTRGVRSGVIVEEHRVITCLQSILPSSDEWSNVLHTATEPNLHVIVSNTTERGIVYDNNDTLGTEEHAPTSFPVKLLACLYARWKAGCTGVIVLPTELIENNGSLLSKYLRCHAERLQLNEEFLSWMQREVIICTTLVDRIVPGRVNESERHMLKQLAGFDDNAALAVEPYRFWAIEASSEQIEELRARIRTYAQWLHHEAIIITNDITQYRERKLRLLNGGHTASAILGLTLGCSTMRELMEHPAGTKFVARALFDEIIPTLPYPYEEMKAFADEVLDRFRNPFLHHNLKTIATNSTTKMAVRVMPIIVHYYERYGVLPECLTQGFAVYLATILRMPSSTVVPTWSDELADALIQTLRQTSTIGNAFFTSSENAEYIQYDNEYGKPDDAQSSIRAVLHQTLNHPVWEALHRSPMAETIRQALLERCTQYIYSSLYSSSES
jgi:tagaturonate reductase